MTIRDVGTAELLIPAHKCTEHAVTFQDSIDLPSTDDPLIGEKVADFEFFGINQKEKLFPADREKMEKEKITTLERVFLV